METNFKNGDFPNSFSSYRTYEEWKPNIENLNSSMTELSSYRTYEEWKLSRPIIFIKSSAKFLPYLWGMETRGGQRVLMLQRLGSYRTYEEWKQPT